MGRTASILFVAAAFCLTGCPLEHDIEYVAEIQSDTYWKAQVNGESIDGFGNEFLQIPRRGADYQLPVCVTVRKQSNAGYLRVRVAADGVSVLGSRDGDWVFTSADSGWVTACSKE